MGQAQVKPDSITVCFQLASNTKGEAATLVYPDLIGGENVTYHPITDGTGRWTVKIPTYRPLHIQIWDDNKIQGVVWGEINLFCDPGTETDILLDDVNDRCVFSGENAEAHQAQISHPLKINNFHRQMFGIGMQEAATHIRNIYSQNIHSIDTLCANNLDLPRRYIDGLRAIARYGYAMDMTQNVMDHFSESLAKFIEEGNTLSQEYLDLFHEVETEDLLHPQGLLPRDAVSYFRDVVSIEDIKKNGIIRPAPEQEDDYELETFKSFCSVIDEIDASDEVKRMMKSTKSLNLFHGEMTEEREKYLRSQFLGDAFGQLQTYIHGIKAEIESSPSLSADELVEAPIDSLANGKDIFQKLIAPYKGRVIYVDVWGTWCDPCMSEMEHISQLHEALDGLPVTYMYLANNSPEELWQKAAKRFGLDGPDCINLRLPDNQQLAVEDYLGVSGFPTFLIVAPDGSIVSSDAPRPSNPSGVRDAIINILAK